jgi:hypothetical protein
MHITKPSCKALGIYQVAGCYERWSHGGPWSWCRDWPVNLKPLYSVRNTDGIKVRELVEALQASLPTLRETWTVGARGFRERIPEFHWLDNIWQYPGLPRFFIVLENMEMNHTDNDHAFHASRLMYMSDQRSRAVTQAEWVGKELMDFGKSDTGRHPINWDLHPDLYDNFYLPWWLYRDARRPGWWYRSVGHARSYSGVRSSWLSYWALHLSLLAFQVGSLSWGAIASFSCGLVRRFLALY